jgi:hypothetical protein
VSDDLLASLDAAFASRSQAGTARPLGRARVVPRVDSEIVVIEQIADTSWNRAGGLEAFFAVQFLWGALMFIPGSQQYRGLVRALPYLSSLALLGVHVGQRAPVSFPRSSGLLMSALLLLVLNLFHSTSQLTAGLAQCVFQLSIAAPLFWAYKAVHSPRQFERLLVLLFLMNFVSAGLGILQVYFPDRFMPPEFSALGRQTNEYYVESLSYMGDNGQAIVRPPGLTDQPGGAAVAGGLTALLGLALSVRSRKAWQRVALLGAVGVGLAVVYLTQVRSVLLMVIVAAAVLSGVAFRRGRVAGASWILATGGALLIASFLWASSIGGATVNERFLTIRNTGAVQTYRENRGRFLAYTVGELLDEFPLGAGVGRWGMINAYFGNPAEFRSPRIYVEIQLTGWLLDGGVPMWLLYGGAILLSMFATFRLTRAPAPFLGDSALVVLAVQVFIAGTAMAQPAFNTQLGILFWALASMLHGAALSTAVAVDSDEAAVSP